MDASGASTATTVPSDRAFWVRWILANAVGEFGGLGLVSLVALLLLAPLDGGADATGGLLVASALVLLGTVEGAVVGAFQWAVLRRRVDGISPRAWIGATAAGAFVAWTLGMAPSTLLSAGPDAAGPPFAPSVALLLALAAGLGALLGPVLALPQWLVLRRQLTGAVWWIPANAAGWALGMPMVFLGVGATDGGLSTESIGAVLAAIALAGALVGAVHGAVLVWLLRR